MLPSVSLDAEFLQLTQRRVLTFSLAGADYALDLRWVREIRTPEPPTPLPGQPAAVLGVNNLRGDMVPLLCLRTQLRHAPAAGGNPGAGAVVVVQLPQGLLGLLVDAVQDVRELDAADLRPTPFPGGSAAHLLGLCNTGTQPLQLLDPMALAHCAALH